jgi:hypothetical protein
MKTWISRPPESRAHSIRKLLAIFSVASMFPLVLAAASPRLATTAAVPGDCNSSFDPYAYTQAAVNACGYTTFSRNAVNALAGGGSSYDYSVNGSNVRFYVPPAGFDPSTATAAQLNEYAFPPRPTDPAALAQWQTEMSNWKGAASPPPFLTETHAQADSVNMYYWAGYALDGNSIVFTHAEAWYLEPTFGSSHCSSDAEVTWAGIGDYSNSGAIGQDGTAYNVAGMGNHQAWWEVYPDVGIMPVNLYGHAGSLFDASTRRISGGYRFYMYDYATSTTQAFDVSINDYDGSSAEAIAERPAAADGSHTNLSNFGTLTFSETQANGNGFNTFNPDGVRHGVHMVKANGDDLADPSAMGSNGTFTVTQKNCD